MSVSTRNATLRRLLDANAAFSLDAVGTTNHLPMALVALAGLGASAQRLEAYFAMWSQRYARALPAVELALNRNNWQGQIGNRAAFGALQALFTEWVAHEGAPKVIAHVLGHIPAAPASGAFHAFIRLGYALEARHEGEVGAALAAFVAGNLAIALDVSERVPAASVETAMARLSEAQAGRSYVGEAITSRLRAVAADPTFDAALQAPPDTPDLLDALSHAAIALYWQTGNFTVLHMVTGLAAGRAVLALLPDALAARYRAALWVAFCAAYASVGAPALRSLPVPDAIATWPELFAAAREDDDDHVIKMTYTCYRESLRDPNPLYRAAAARLVGQALAA
ncbi:questin oxidase family protein [Chitinimonas sp.]|uniref:questin oxidase family protein n=1 Tax=Chitinimonas sp. TaxID=1934313 RepID=UPI002F91D34D